MPEDSEPGSETQTGRIGYLAYAPSYRNILLANAFALGVQAANPEATVELIWTGAWYDPDLERSAALELLDRGCDVLGQELGSTAALQAAAQRGAWAVGSGVITGMDTSTLAPGGTATRAQAAAMLRVLSDVL